MEMMIAYLVMFGMLFFGAFPVLFAIKKANKHSKEDVLSAEDFKNDEENYMNIITKISPAVLAYVDSMKFNFSQTVTAILLQLKMKEAIKYEKHGLVKLKELRDMKSPEYGDLEKYILGCIRENGQVFASRKDLEQLVIAEAKKQNVLENNTYEKFHKRCGIIFSILVVLFFTSKILARLDTTWEFGWFLGIATQVSSIALYIYFFMYDAGKYQRTEYGIEINKKIEGLKNYIKEYSLLHEKNSDAIKIWDEYYIYYAIFDKKSMEIVEHIKYIRIKPEKH